MKFFFFKNKHKKYNKIKTTTEGKIDFDVIRKTKK